MLSSGDAVISDISLLFPCYSDRPRIAGSALRWKWIKIWTKWATLVHIIKLTNTNLTTVGALVRCLISNQPPALVSPVFSGLIRSWSFIQHPPEEWQKGLRSEPETCLPSPWVRAELWFFPILSPLKAFAFIFLSGAGVSGYLEIRGRGKATIISTLKKRQ